MSEKQFEIKADDVDSSIINITRDGEDFAWFLSDIVTDKQVEKVVDKLNEQQATIKQLKKDKEILKEEIRAYPINEQYAEEIMQQNQKLRIEKNDLRIENEKLRKKIVWIS